MAYQHPLAECREPLGELRRIGCRPVRCRIPDLRQLVLLGTAEIAQMVCHAVYLWGVEQPASVSGQQHQHTQPEGEQ